NVFVLPFLPYKDMAYAFSLGDVGLIICKPGVGGAAVPSKTWNIMAAERPVLASFDRNSGLASLIESVGCGVVADAGSKEELIQAIRNLMADPCLAEKGKLGKDYLLTELDKEKCVGKYVRTLMEVLK
ncbi:MAG: glycosyltransferase WbuB, partial [Bacteroidales bacterium]|nr:glycosyltransferase WbuB [Bacteroidales bacterium]